MKKINLLDLFSGIGGFHKGLEQAGFKVNSYFSEVDKHAISVYQNNFKKSTYVGSVTNVRGTQLPRINAITFGSPCQDFSIAGKRQGMDGKRSSLILEAIRLIRECRPDFFIWENVKGTFSSNNREDFAAILQAFANIGGYRLEWELLNSSWFLPQNRQRIYLVGYFGGRGGQSVFPIGEPSKISNNRNTEVANTLQHPGHSGGNYRGMTMIAEATKKGYAEAEVGDAINLERPTSKTRRGRVTKGYAQSLETIQHQHTIQPGLTQNHSNIRRFTPKECERLQGFPDDWTSKGIIDGKVVDMSDTQRYKQCGNAVTVDVVQAVGEKIYTLLYNQDK